uniref:Nodule-specific cysteine-rich peptide L28 n=1 Tax=Lens culinaris TaxID=3864 RepID=A0A7T8DVP5_LENCU|nr:nodule-specific cysteine-rich peptide L28 [Lens culinaris]
MWKNMAKVLMFVYVIILFLFICINMTDGNACEDDEDCPTSLCFPSEVPECISMKCICVKIVLDLQTILN